MSYFKRLLSKFSAQPVEKTAVFLIATKEYAFAVATTCLGLLKHNTESSFVFYVMHDGISENDQNILISLLGDVNFISMSHSYFHKEMSDILKERYDRSKVDDLLSRRKLYFIAKPLCLKVLSKYKRVLFLDTDLLVSGNLRNLFDLDGVAWRNAVAPCTEKLHLALKNNPAYFSPIPPSASAPNAGVMYFTNSIEFESILEECLWVLQEYHSELRRDLDEAVISWAVHKLHIVPHELMKIYNHYANDVHDKTIITHAIGDIKFWSANYRRIIHHEWNNYYKLWVSAGGSEYSGPQEEDRYFKSPDNHGAVARYIQRSLVWERLYNILEDNLPSELYRAGPMAEVYSQLYVRGKSRRIHFEIQMEGVGAAVKYWVSFFVKSGPSLSAPSIQFMDVKEIKSPFKIVERKDIFQIKSSKSVTADQVVPHLMELMFQLNNAGLDLGKLNEEILVKK